MSTPNDTARLSDATVAMLDTLVYRQNAAQSILTDLWRRIERASDANDAATVHWLHKRLMAIDRDYQKRGRSNG